MKNIHRQLLCILIIVVMLSSIITTPVYALDSAAIIRAKSWIATAITAANVFLSPLNYAGTHAIQDAIDPLNLVSTISEQDYTYYMDRSTIKIYPDVVVIDGVPYTDIWLSNNAADKFRTEGFDFFTAYSIASNSNATYASGLGYLDGTPIYSVNGLYNGSQIFGPFPASYSTLATGNGRIYSGVNGTNPNDYRWIDYLTSDNVRLISGNLSNHQYARNPIYMQFKYLNSYWRLCAGLNPNEINYYAVTGLDNYYVSSPFEFDYVSNIIDNTPLLPDEGMYIRVPSSHTNTTHPERSYNIPDYVNNNPGIDNYTFNFDPNTNPNYQIDLDLNDSLGDIITAIIIARLLDLINDPNIIIDYDVDPEPTPPVTDPTIAEQKYSVLDHILQSIKDVLDDILETVENWFDDIKDVLDDILSQITQELSAIKSFLQSIYNTLSTIPSLLQTLFNDLADKILQDIEEGPIKLLDKLLDVLRTLFFPILATLKSFLGIWHYVVEWLSNISNPFTWIIGIMAATSSVLMSPIYALIAGIIVIAVYRRFGR